MEEAMVIQWVLAMNPKRRMNRALTIFWYAELDQRYGMG
jgi:hypothetical protein